MPESLVGQSFGRWTVIAFHSRDARQTRHWLCECWCGVKRPVPTGKLTGGYSLSCGCLNRERSSVHRMSQSPEYKTWQHILNRCYNPNATEYRYYGGRGITVCERWRSDFLSFFCDVGLRPSPQHSLGRIDNNGIYSPLNCQWETPEQQANNKRNNRLITHDGKTLTISQWSRVTGLGHSTITARLNRGCKPADALSLTKWRTMPETRKVNLAT